MRRKFWIVIILITTLLGVVSLSAGISRMELSSEWDLYDFDDDNDQERTTTAAEILDRLPRLPEGLWQIFSVFLVILVPLALIIALFSPEIRKSLFKEFRKAVPFIAMAAAILYLLNRIQLENFQPPGADLLKSPPDMPSWMSNPTAVAAFLIGLTIVTLIFLTFYFLWQRSRLLPLYQIAEEAQATADQIRYGGNYKNAIIKCYVNMCEVLRENQRIERKQFMTAREFAYQLENLGISGWHAYRLTHLFEGVRYGAVTSKHGDEQEAIECLTAITELAEKRKRGAVLSRGLKLEY